MLNELLQTLGHTPTATAPTRTTYKSPWNADEKTPSCFVFSNKEWNGQDPLREFNYKDNSSGNGGNIFHFVMNYFNISFVDAKSKIIELTGTNPTVPPKPHSPSSFSFNHQKEESYQITKVQQLQNKALIDYLTKERGLVSISLTRYLSEVYYKIKDKSYFALSFVNDAGGREVRNKYFKACLGEKDISLITPNPKDKRVKIFEGFMDFLSYLEINRNAPLSNYLILNSASMQEKGLRAIEGNFEAFELYLDNDRKGDETTQFFMNNLANSIDKRVYYKDHKDLNEYLLNMQEQSNVR